MLNMPFFLLTNRDRHRQEDLIFEVEEREADQLVRRTWQVSASNRFGYPIPYDKRVFRAIEAIIDSRGQPAQNPIRFTTYELLRKMGESIGGRQYKLVRESLDRIISTTIIAKNIFWRKDRKQWHSETFHVYERCVYQGDQTEDGRVAECNSLYLHPLYLDSLNARYVKPLDYDYFKSLRRPLSRRLYELLGYKFYGALLNDSLTLQYNYTTLCQLLPMKEQLYLSLAKRCLGPAHQELIKTEFLESVSWQDWKLSYTIGERGLTEIRSILQEAK